MKKYSLLAAILFIGLITTQAAQLTGALRINTDTTGTNTKSSAITVTLQTNLLTGSITVSNLTASALTGSDSGKALATVNLTGAVTTSGSLATTLTTNQSQQKVWVRVGTTNLGVFDNVTFWPGANITMTTTNGTGNTNIDVSITGSAGGSTIGYALKFGGTDTSFSPSSGGFTLYSGGSVFGVPSTSFTNQCVPIFKTGTIKGIGVRIRDDGTLGSSENVTFKISINGAAGSGTGVIMPISAVNNLGTSSSESIAVTAGQTIALTFTTPTWATPPTACYIESWVYIE